MYAHVQCKTKGMRTLGCRTAKTASAESHTGNMAKSKTMSAVNAAKEMIWRTAVATRRIKSFSLDSV